MDRLCPICKRKLTKEDKISFIDYHCSPPPTDHHYQERVKNDEVLMFKVRLTEPDKSRIFLKVDFWTDRAQVWTRAAGISQDSDDRDRIDINHAFMPDLSSVDKLRNKIKTYLMFA